jgi:hypothetical protein
MTELYIALNLGASISHPVAVCHTLERAQQACRDFAGTPLTEFTGISASGDESIWRAEPVDVPQPFDNGFFIYLMAVTE